MAQRRWQQFEVRPLAGSELWVMVRHPKGMFKLPADAAVSELLQGVADGWTLTPSKTARATLYVRVPLHDALLQVHHPR